MQQWTREELIKQLNLNQTTIVYIYTSMCGTCQVASKMLTIVEELVPNLPLGKMNVNDIKNEVHNWQVESVPCLLFLENEKLISKIYAFHSVPYLMELLKPFEMKNS